jgi:ribosomal protein S14
MAAAPRPFPHAEGNVTGRFLNFVQPKKEVIRCNRCGQHASVVISGVILCGDCFLRQSERKLPAVLRPAISA